MSSTSSFITPNIVTTTTLNRTLNNNNPIISSCSRTFSIANPIYQNMREFIFDLCDKGIGAVESNEQIRERFGEQAPTLCTIYKWRREYRGGKVFFFKIKKIFFIFLKLL